MRLGTIAGLVAQCACGGPWRVLDIPPGPSQQVASRLSQPSSFSKNGSQLCSIYGEARPELSTLVLNAVMALVIKPHERVVAAYAYHGWRGGDSDHRSSMPAGTSLKKAEVRVSIEARRDRGFVDVDVYDGSTSYCVYFKYGKDGRVNEIVLDESWKSAP